MIQNSPIQSRPRKLLRTLTCYGFGLGTITALLTSGGVALAQTPDASSAEPLVAIESRAFAATPPMGWNSWNKFGCNVSEQTIRSATDAIVSTGMRDAGYSYVVVDDCWHGQRDADGNITADPVHFPSGIKALSDYVHSKGLKFGIYSDAGALTCAHRSGSQGHEYQDALTYARWGVDYLKYDWCSTGSRNGQEAYSLMARALRASGRAIILSLCEWGTNEPWLWRPYPGQLWRTTGDISDVWKARKVDQLGVQGRRLRQDGEAELWVKPLSGGRQAVLLLNRGEQPTSIKAAWDILGWSATTRATVRDVWAHRDLPGAAKGVAMTVPSHGVQMIIVSRKS
ncbi:MAG: glycoside hydrolase family 27 protein [Lysobacteraceae bacterium]|nr:MAG: glycoside hydrolase family 27 protein [Xanthomonadaceae bacterium]